LVRALALQARCRGFESLNAHQVNQPHLSDPDFVVLRALRCIGSAGEERVADASGLDTGDTVVRLRNLSDRGLVILDPGPFGGWGLTESGRITDQELVREELDTVGGRDHVLRAYESFLGLNPALLDICGDWQMRRLGSTPMLNDHTDPDYDARVLSRLIRIDASAQRICSDLGSRLTRFGLYGIRLTTSLERALGGNTAYVTDTLDSYHTVWFQLHEDLLVTLGISREEERRDTPGTS
jgi:DNA-binding MarR family transcriptional regulator